jgi:hypothetical protein
MIYVDLLNGLLFGQGQLIINGAFAGGGGESGSSSPGQPSISVTTIPSLTLQTSNYWMLDNVWGATGLTRVTTEGSFSGISGTTYYQFVGVDQPALSVSTTAGHAPAAARWRWGFPTGTTEVKSYPALWAGEKPGWFNTGAGPAGIPILLPNGTTSTVAPSGPTPNDFFPIALTSLSTGGGKTLVSTWNFAHNETPTGRGHLSYDIWLQSSATQVNGFQAPPVTVEIMIPLAYWGNYGAYFNGRNPAWYSHDITIQGKLWHVYNASLLPGDVPFNGEWRLVVFQPDAPGSPSSFAITSLSSLDLAEFLTYAGTVGLWAGWTSTEATATHVVNVELGVEAIDGTGDLTLYNFTVKP